MGFNSEFKGLMHSEYPTQQQGHKYYNRTRWRYLFIDDRNKEYTSAQIMYKYAWGKPLSLVLQYILPAVFCVRCPETMLQELSLQLSFLAVIFLQRMIDCALNTSPHPPSSQELTCMCLIID